MTLCPKCGKHVPDIRLGSMVDPQNAELNMFYCRCGFGFNQDSPTYNRRPAVPTEEEEYKNIKKAIHEAFEEAKNFKMLKEDCICSDYDGKGKSTCGFPCPVHPVEGTSTKKQPTGIPSTKGWEKRLEEWANSWVTGITGSFMEGRDIKQHIKRYFVGELALARLEGAKEERKRLKALGKRKFPRGERLWCIQCVSRLVEALEEKSK